MGGVLIILAERHLPQLLCLSQSRTAWGALGSLSSEMMLI